MELLKTFGLDWRLLVWQIINFAIVVFVLKKFAFGPIIAGLAKRTARLEQGLKDADAARENLDSTERERREVLSKARTEAGKILSETRAAAETLRDDLVAKARAEVEEVVLRGKERLTAEKEGMVTAARAEIGELVVAAVLKVLPRELTGKDHEKLVADAAAILGKK